MKNIFLSIIFLVTLFIPVSANATVTAGYEQKVNWIATYPIVSIDNNPTAQDVINQDLNRYLEQLRSDFRNGRYYICKEWYKVRYEDANLLSISIYQIRLPYLGNGNHTRSYDIVYDKNTGQRIPLYNYVHVTPNDLEYYRGGHTYNYMDRHLDRRTDSRRITYVPENYFLLGGGVVCVVFQPYQIGSGADSNCYIRLEPNYIEYLNRKNR